MTLETPEEWIIEEPFFNYFGVDVLGPPSVNDGPKIHMRHGTMPTHDH